MAIATVYVHYLFILAPDDRQRSLIFPEIMNLNSDRSLGIIIKVIIHKSYEKRLRNV